MKKIIVVALSVVFLVGVFTVVAPVQAASLREIQNQIQSLLGQVKQLEAQNQGAAAVSAVADIAADISGSATAKWCFTFKSNLRRGDTGRAVANLHIALQKDGYAIDKGEINHKRFGDSTKSAVIGFQNKYASEILTPLGETKGTGLVGNTTRAKLNQLYGCAANNITPTTTIITELAPPIAIVVPETFAGSLGATTTIPRPPITSPSITVISPNGGEKWEVGKTQTILWKGPSSGYKFSLLLIGPGGIASEGLGQELFNEGADRYSWTIPSNQKLGQYQLKIGLCPKDNTDVYCLNIDLSTYGFDISDAPFSIVEAGTSQQPTISIISPDSGPIGTKVQLVGDFNLSNNIVQFGPVAIPNLSSVFSEGAGADIMYFTVPQSRPSSCTIDGICTKDLRYIEPGKTYPVKVINTNGESNSVDFTVTTTSTSTPSITVVSPNGGEKWQIGSMHTITWTPYEPGCKDPNEPYCESNSGINPADSVTAHLEQFIPGINQFVGIGKIVEGGKASIHWDGVSLEDFSGNYLEAKPGDYYIRVVNNTTGASDRSDNAFKLMARDSVTADLKLNGSDGPIKVPSGGKTYTASWTSNADSCNLYNNTLPWPEGLTLNLPSSGNQLIKLMPNKDIFDVNVALNCLSKSNVEGYAWDFVTVLPSPESFAEIIFPNGGEVMDWSSSQFVFWKSMGIKSVSLALYKNNKFFAWIVKDLPSNTNSVFGQYQWNPSSVISHDKIGKKVFKIYMIGKKAGARGTVTDKSDKPFTIVMPKG